MKIFLIGLMGSGKSFLGKEIENQAGLSFLDLDTEIEKQEGRTISDIFSSEGEEYFRRVEAASIRKCSEAKEFVMATGGGTPCFHDNMNFILQSGTSIFLDTPIKEILKRITGVQKNLRPLLRDLSDLEVEKILTSMLENRMPFYTMANFTVNGAATTAKDILQLLNSKK
jgi:shikimate kinase